MTKFISFCRYTEIKREIEKKAAKDKKKSGIKSTTKSKSDMV